MIEQRTDEERVAYLQGYLAAAADGPALRAAYQPQARQELSDLLNPRPPEDDAALAILEALAEEFAGEAIPHVWVHPDGFYGLPALSAGILDEGNRWTFALITRIFALDAVNPGAIAAQDLRRAFDARHAVDELA